MGQPLTEQAMVRPAQSAPEREELATWVREARSRVLELVADLDEQQMVARLLPTINPLIWEIGHVAWFQEYFVLRQALGQPPLVPEADALWDSSAVPHDTRWFLRLPSRQDTVAYMQETADRVAEWILADEATDVLEHIARYAVHHEDWHTEALTYTRQTLGYRPPAIFALAQPAGAARETGALPGDVQVPGGRFLLGALRSAPFVFDNEKWAHPVEIAPFRIARAPVTQSEYAAFVEDGGYRRRELWSADVWDWLQASAVEVPLYWRRGAGGWERRHFDRWVPLEPDRPMVHVSYLEADAFCRWAGRRLPTEAEWEAAAIGEPDRGGRLSPNRRRWPWGDAPLSPDRANTDWRLMDTADVAAFPEGDSAFGCRQMIGNVWEWTSSVFLPYPGFERDAYRQNSEPWFGDRRVLRGGAWASRGRLLRGTLRNYFTPERRDAYAGFRTVAL